MMTSSGANGSGSSSSSSVLSARRWSGLRKPSVILLALLLSGCAGGLAASRAFSRLPGLEAAPQKGICVVAGEPRACLAVLETDWQALVIYAKGVCLSLGGTQEDCQAKEEGR